MTELRPKLTDAQLRLLIELTEPNENSDGMWFFGRRTRRPGDVLVRHGFATSDSSGGGFRVGYAITRKGREHLVALGVTAAWSEAEPTP